MCPQHGIFLFPGVGMSNVDHPAHYGGHDNPFECIKVLRAWLTPEQFSGFLLGNCLKYLSRLGKKGDLLEDLAKARWYADAYLNYLKETRNDDGHPPHE
jgi:hypothetical protein